jgi:O-antigen/teichoic acid export membrane protein
MRGTGQLRINIITSLGSTLLSTLVMGVAYPLYLHYLGYEQYGLWLVLSTVLTMAQLGNLGISPALLKLAAEDYAAGDIDGIYKYISCALLSLLVSGSILVWGVWLLRQPIISLFGMSGDHAGIAYVLLPYVGVLSVYLLMADALNSVLAGLGRYDLVSYSQVSGQIVTVVTALVLFKLRCGIWSLLIANACGALFLNIVSLALIRGITESGSWLRLSWDRRRLRRILNFGSWVFGASMVSAIMNPINKLLITRFTGIGAVPVYDISYAAAMKFRSLFESGFRSLTPEFSSLNALCPRDAHDSLSSADRKGLRAVLYWGTPAYAAVFLCCGWGLPWWLGARFTPELPGVFRIMLMGTYLSLWGVQPWYSLLGFGRSRQIFLSNVVQALSNVGLVLLWPAPTLITVTVGTGAGMLTSTLYLRRQGARLRKNSGACAARDLPPVEAAPDIGLAV